LEFLAAEIQEKFEGLKTTFTAKSKKGKTGDGATLEKWHLFDSLLFLRKVTGQRQSITNVLKVHKHVIYENSTFDLRIVIFIVNYEF
jgi:hypothetical protein